MIRNPKTDIATIDNDTIVALATPPGRGGVAIVRVSGNRVKPIAEKILQTIPDPRSAIYRKFLDVNNTTIDEGIALYFPRPHSFTGEDVLELHCHGGPIIVDLLIQTILQNGARLAEAGEFTQRAFLNDKIDLVQAESIADMIAASSEQAARAAVRSLQGEFSNYIQDLVEQLIRLRMYIEAAIDFVDEEIDFLAHSQIINTIKNVHASLQSVLQSAQQGCLLRDGIAVVIAGEPNVGKSSLLNKLSSRDVAIVTDIPGTTRDVLRQEILLDGIPLHIIDTAGLRASDDLVEQEGIRRATLEIANADLILVMQDVSNTESLPDTIKMLPAKVQKIFIKNKIDLHNVDPQVLNENGYTRVYISVKNNLGIDLLKQTIKNIIGFSENSAGSFSARRRHIDALQRAKQHIENAEFQIEAQQSELLAEELRLAQIELSAITGEFSSDDLLGRIFADFCIGK